MEGHINNNAKNKQTNAIDVIQLTYRFYFVALQGIRQKKENVKYLWHQK